MREAFHAQMETVVRSQIITRTLQRTAVTAKAASSALARRLIRYLRSFVFPGVDELLDVHESIQLLENILENHEANGTFSPVHHIENGGIAEGFDVVGTHPKQHKVHQREFFSRWRLQFDKFRDRRQLEAVLRDGGVRVKVQRIAETRGGHEEAAQRTKPSEHTVEGGTQDVQVAVVVLHVLGEGRLQNHALQPRGDGRNLENSVQQAVQMRMVQPLKCKPAVLFNERHEVGVLLLVLHGGSDRLAQLLEFTRSAPGVVAALQCFNDVVNCAFHAGLLRQLGHDGFPLDEDVQALPGLLVRQEVLHVLVVDPGCGNADAAGWPGLKKVFQYLLRKLLHRHLRAKNGAAAGAPSAGVHGD
mmetsp:Transcript_146104/g.468625  ORF Transcript_146104/g.468625 Transcript_146104/m.468625 type:complete len:359 (+) Transcript_146104:390-1466(+)